MLGPYIFTDRAVVMLALQAQTCLRHPAISCSISRMDMDWASLNVQAIMPRGLGMGMLMSTSEMLHSRCHKRAHSQANSGGNVVSPNSLLGPES